ncbi:MAG: hypothetical protein ABIF77_05390 [bacterium]
MQYLRLSLITGIVIVCFLMGFFLLVNIDSPRANWVTFLSFIISVLGFGFTAYTLLRLRDEASRQRLDRDEIDIKVAYGTELVDLAYRPLRSQLSRGELLGIIGMYGGGGRFEPKDMLELVCRGDLNRVADGTSNQITIRLDAKDPLAEELFREIRTRNSHCVRQLTSQQTPQHLSSREE